MTKQCCKQVAQDFHDMIRFLKVGDLSNEDFKELVLVCKKHGIDDNFDEETKKEFGVD